MGEECISGAELKELITARGRGTDGPGFNLYDGFEPSGRMHIAQGVFKAMNVNKCTAAGTNATFVFWVADWFALMNDKMGGDLEKIRTVGHYLIEVWKAAGMNLDNVTFKWASEEITQHADKYWPTMLDVARRFNITRVKKCCQIMGRLEGSLTAAQILYPLMQCTDVFFLNANICQLGVDQRKVNMLAREYCDAAGIKHKPIILSHHMLFGLKAGQEKMSKSDPDSAIFMEDAADDVERKIRNAYCPTKPEASKPTSTASNTDIDAGLQSMHLVEDDLKNPCLDYICHIIFSSPGATFSAGSKVFDDFDSVKESFLSGETNESELKAGLVAALNLLLEPVRNHFETDANAKSLLAQVQQFKKEAAVKTPSKQIRRLNLVESGMAPGGAHVVFAGLPDPNPPLQEAADIILQLRQANGRPCILFLSDWTARVCNACDGDVKSISAYFILLLAALRLLDGPMMENVKVIYQSEAILSDPSNYWISVINVGRHFMLNDIMGQDVKDADGAGIVIGRLMRVADAMGLSPASVSLNDNAGSRVEGSLIGRFFCDALAGSVAPPIVTMYVSKSIRLQAERESDAYKTENDEYFLLDDPKVGPIDALYRKQVYVRLRVVLHFFHRLPSFLQVHGKAKMKKAFCEPGNIDFCPPIALASVFTFDLGTVGNDSVTIKRSEENGGDIDYKNVEAMVKSFSDGSLHPGDLKAASSAIMMEVLDKLASGIKADSEASKSGKALKALQKKMAKRKK